MVETTSNFVGSESNIDEEEEKKEEDREEEKWKKSFEASTDKGLRNNSGQFTTMEREHERAIEDNELLDILNGKIDKIRETLDELSDQINRPEEKWKKSFEASTDKGLRNNSGQFTTMEREHERAIEDNENLGNQQNNESENDDLEPLNTPDSLPDSGENYYSAQYYRPLYTPSYTPERPDYTPNPEIPDRKQEVLRLINELAKRDQERAIERYGGFRPFSALAGFLRIVRLRGVAEKLEQTDQKLSSGSIGRTVGKIRSWFDKVGHRRILTEEQIEDDSIIDENLQQVGNFKKSLWWRKAAKIGAKILGGFGAAAATVLTGGAGAATALMWAGGLKEGYDGVLQTGEHLGWGRKRSAAELERQSTLSEKIDALKARVVDTENPLTDQEFGELLSDIFDSERELIERETENIGGEKKGQMVRSITSSALTIGTGLFAGVPLGKVNYDQDNTQLAEAARHFIGPEDAKVMEADHRGFWDMLKGGQFAYEHVETMADGSVRSDLLAAIQDAANGATPSGAEYEKMKALVNGVNQVFLERKVNPEDLFVFNEISSAYGQTAHELGHGLAAVDKLKIGAAGAYLLGEVMRHFSKKPQETPRPGYYSEYYSANNRYNPNNNSGNRSQETAGNPISTPETTEPSDDAEAVGRERTKVSEYLDSLPAEYKEEIETMSNQLPEMDEKCRLSICVPAAYSEHRIIYNYLDALKGQEDTNGQPLDPKTFEVIIFVNGPEDKSDEVQQTIEEIKRFKADNPDFTVYTISKTFAERQPIGRLRKIVNDVAINRSLGRENEIQPFYLVSHDADTEVTDKDYIDRSIKKMDGNYEYKLLAGSSDLHGEIKKKYPIIWASRRLWQFIDEARTGKRYGGMLRKALGNNSIIRSEAYAQVGGYREHDQVAEDLALAQSIDQAYEGEGRDRGHKPVDNLGIHVNLSPRRDIQSIENGRPIISGYEDFGGNQRVREDLRTDNVESITPADPDKFKDHLQLEATSQFNNLFFEQFYNRSDKSPEIIEARRRGKPQRAIENIQLRQLQGELGKEALADTEKTFYKACDYLGMKVAIRPEDQRYAVEITDWSKIKQQLEARPRTW